MKLREEILDKMLTVLFTGLCLLTLSAAAVAQGKIAFDSFRDGNFEIYVMNADGTDQTRLTNNSSTDREPSISPDASKIVFTATRDGNDEIYVMNVDGTNQTRLTNNAVIDREPSFSPDGNKITFISTRDSAFEVYVMNADGTNVNRLTNNAAFEEQPSFSPDGSKIAFVSDRDAGDLEIYIMNANGTGQTRLTNHTDADVLPAFSPDGTRIAFSSAQSNGNFEIYAMNPNGTGQANVTSHPGDSSYNGSYSPDGNKIAFVRLSNIYVMNANGTNQTALTVSGLDAHPTWGGVPNTAPTITAIGATREQDAGSSNSAIATVNDAQDAENTLSVTVNGGSSAASNGVSISGIAVSSSGNVTANITAICGATNASFTLRVTDSGTLYADATLNVTVTAETVPPVLSLPSNVVTSLPLNSTTLSKVVTFAVSATDNCDPNPVVGAVPASSSAFTVGTTTVNVTATDASGNPASGSFTVTVAYDFLGFFQPVDNLPTVNTVNAGQAIPVKFSLSGNKGLNIFAAGFPVSQQINCVAGTPVSPIEETVTAGASSLSYDATSDRYIYVWQTERAWRGTCRQLIVGLNDGSMHIANFQYR